MNEPELSEAEGAGLFGGPAREIQADSDSLEVELALRTVRALLMEAAEDDKIGVNQLARRLHISPSSVSRFFGNDGDFHLSTAVLYGHALGRRWDFSLLRDASCAVRGNHSWRPEIVQQGSVSPCTSGATGIAYASASPSVPIADPALELKVKATA